ncbi:nitroreductase family protein [Acinetobacter sp. B51(2017)]|uniref:nitroreductase family protein n=1 Tax=Acinetobacter sp. B51(2017) TaxID=2060938 RepID=UPI000F07469E|nr:nitroreductase family protein [Acinetobacter sp. B51(2017)]
MALFSKIGQVFTTDLRKEFQLKKTNTHSEKAFIEYLQACQPMAKLGKKVHLSQNYLSALIIEAIKRCPSIQGVQGLKFVVLYHEAHQNFWQLVEAQQRQEIPVHVFAATAYKMQACQNALGTILFFEDQQALQHLAKKQPLLAEQHPNWLAQYLGAISLAAWGALADVGLGAELLHYQGFDHSLQKKFQLEPSWQLKAQLLFGSIEDKKTTVSSTFSAKDYQVLTECSKSETMCYEIASR